MMNGVTDLLQYDITINYEIFRDLLNAGATILGLIFMPYGPDNTTPGILSCWVKIRIPRSGGAPSFVNYAKVPYETMGYTSIPYQQMHRVRVSGFSVQVTKDSVNTQTPTSYTYFPVADVHYWFTNQGDVIPCDVSTTVTLSGTNDSYVMTALPREPRQVEFQTSDQFEYTGIYVELPSSSIYGLTFTIRGGLEVI